jgi:hypothetical protein
MPDGAFRPYLKQQLINNGFKVETPAFPNTNFPKMEEWIPFMQTVITSPLDATILVGHSLGATAVLRFLETLPDNKKLRKAVFVAGAYDVVSNLNKSEQEIAKPWFDKPYNLTKITDSVSEITAFFSDNDKYIPLDTAEKMKTNLGAKVIIEHDMGHYNEETGITETPTILREILETK